MSDETRKIADEEMKLLGLKDRQFAEYLMEGFSKDGDTFVKSHGTIINWRKHGRFPATDTLEDMLSIYEPGDRRFVFALRMLAAKSPHIWGFEGVVWRLRDVIKVKS